jgi:leader peptidase (prepilin peptidase)/N-methyltransferase
MVAGFGATVWAGLFGLCLGSFANVFLARYPQGESLWWPPSRCPHCGQPIRWWHNVPLLGWLWLRGRCRDCHQPISPLYPLVEAAFGLLAWVWVARFGSGPYSLYLGGFCLVLLLAGIVDWHTMHIYDVLTYPLGLGGLLTSVFFPLAYNGQRWHSAAAMAAMAATMFLLAGLGRLYAKREALGGGDIKLMIAAAGFLGWPVAWSALMMGALLGLPLMLLYQRLNRLAWRDPAPFGPALALACGLAAWDLAGGGLVLRIYDPFF